MTVHQIKHAVWGDNFANQLATDKVRVEGHNEKVMVKGWFGGMKEENKYIETSYRQATDYDTTKRAYRHRCGLLKIVMTPHRDGPMFIVFLDGHVASNFVSSEMEYRFVPDELVDNGGKPIAEFWFTGTGKRHGHLNDYGTSRVICTFASKEQMEEYLDLTNRRMPKSITHQGVTYNSTSTGNYQSSSGSMLPYMLLMYYMLSSHEQQAFAQQNPEVQTMLGGGGSFGVAGASGVIPEVNNSQQSGTDNQTVTDGATYDSGGSDSGSSDSGSSGSSSDSGSSSSDSGNSSSSGGGD